jgi:Protein of unknown function (DUF4058)
MTMPFPGMDPYLEHPRLWGGFNLVLLVKLANQLQEHLNPRYVVSIGRHRYRDEAANRYVDILEVDNQTKPVTRIEVLNPANKIPGRLRESYLSEQEQIRTTDCHLVEIDLLRAGQPVASAFKVEPQWDPTSDRPRYSYLISVARYDRRIPIACPTRREALWGLSLLPPRAAASHWDPLGWNEGSRLTRSPGGGG